ncbi:DUF2586 family protein [Niabella insulamsoli]|uniref:DUF2586 family protein n=1 Tax=Niabella insulamsoli TaxID=3144874 RepID=UPI0031FC7808
MALPRVIIQFENGNLRQTVPSPDGVGGIVCTGVAVAGKFNLATAYSIRRFEDLETLGITADNNPEIFKIVSEFYTEAAINVELWIMGLADTVKLSDMADQAQEYGKKLINAANGRLRWIAFSRKPAAGYTPTITDGLDGDVYTAMTNAQALCEWATNTKYAPLFAIIEGAGFSGTAADLEAINTGTDNRVAVLIGDTVADSDKAAVGLVCGRIAANPVQRNIGRVKDGTIAAAALYIGALTVDASDFESIHDKGFITFRTIVGRSGYYFSDDNLATVVSDDYNHITARRTVDKAYRLAYDTMINELLDEVPVNADYTLQDGFIKTWQGNILSAISQQMTANGELSADLQNGDRGVQVIIDPNQNVASSGKIMVRVRVRPFGYARYIDVYLGFQAVPV